MLTRDQIDCLKRVLAAARGEVPVPAADPDLVEAELVVDDLEAAVEAYETWLDERAAEKDNHPEPWAALPW